MPTSTRATPLCRYHYDPLDRLVDCTVFEQSATRRFYCKSLLANEIQGAMQRTIVQYDNQLLAQQEREDGKVAATLLATDHQRSILNALDTNQPNPLAYSPYGHRPAENGLLGLLGFNGERPDPVTGQYHLGNGCRQFNPVLMRFNSPDSLSPFGEGGLNAYAYCSGDPVNFVDPTGRAGVLNPFMRLKYINSALKHAQKKITPMTVGNAQIKYGIRPNQTNPLDIRSVNKSLAEKALNTFDESAKIETRLIQEGKMTPINITDNGAEAAKHYAPIDDNAIPSTKQMLTKTGVNGQKMLNTDQFDTAFSYFHTKALAAPEEEIWKIRAGNTLYKRAKYIIRHSDSIRNAHQNF
ncbi:hypothetical protein PS838_01031 [Pseudomonas fluorescens]|jgi:RHS repeat-associated protein|nr:hypothetical protein PS838_01031 [Pseudomonas fluorescens]